MKQKLLLFFIGTCIALMATTKLDAQCSVFSPDYVADFTTIPYDCWEEATDGDASTGPIGIGSGSWSADGFLNNGSSGAYKINLWQNSKSDWILSPQFDLTGGSFQVEFDFGIMQFGSSINVGTLGSDDTVQLLMTNDNGATWITLLTYDSNSDVPVTGDHPIVDLAAYSGQTVQFGILGSEGTIDDTNDVDVFVDNFRVGSPITCPSPIDLTATNLSLTSTEISWTETGTATSWNIEYGIAGFTLGSGIVISDVLTNPYFITGLLPDTNYEFYIQGICGPEDVSSWSAPRPFFTGYCESIPTSNDGEGVTNVTIGITDFLSLGDLTYENHTANSVSVFQGVNNTVVIEFGHSFTYNTNIWIDLNDDLLFDANELVFQGESEGANNPHTLDASFVLPSTAPLGEHRMRIGSADIGQSTPNPCYTGSWGVTLDFRVNIQQLNCVQPEANYSISTNCETEEFYIEVNITSLGDASSLAISNTYNEVTVQATALETYQAGPFPMGNSVQVFVTNEQDNNCVISSDLFDVLACPPSNDECTTATIAEVNDGTICDVVTSGTILAATPSGMQNNSCNGIPNDDVWFSFTALSEVQIISLINIQGGTFNLDHTVYEGSCGSLIELYCSQDDSSITPNLVIGNTYYIQVYSSGDELETSSFDLCLKEAQSNYICDNATMFCTVNGGLTNSNITGVEGFGSIACLGSSPNPSWNAIQIGDPGLIELEIVQSDFDGNGLDVDFVLWGPFDSISNACDAVIIDSCSECPDNTTNPDFYPFGNIIDCSYSAASVESVTIDNAQTGEVYIMLVTNFSGGSGTITIEQTNLGEEGSGSLTGDFEIALGPDINVCEGEQEIVTLNASSPFADNYEWFYNGILLDSGPTVNLIDVTQSGTYNVIAYNENCESLAEDEIVVSFLDCDNTGIISVSAFHDNNVNAVFDATEINATNGYFTYEMNNDGVINTIESSTGSFTIASLDETNTYDINYYFYTEYEDCYDVSTASFEDVTVLFGENVSVDFPVVNEQSCEDISVYLINQQAPRPGFNHVNYLVINNLGLTTVSGTIDYTLDEDLIINSISTNGNYTTTLNASGFSLDFYNLLPEQSIIVTISLQTPTSVALGEMVTNTAIYTTSTNDIVTANNESSITEEVIGAYDPNDKMESHGPEIVYDDFATSDEYLYYTIRFQNLGTAEAVNVRIEDVLDSQLDENTFQMLRSSHNYVVTRVNNNLEWNFENINLPAEQDDADNSIGFVYFKIKPNSGYAIGDIIPNSASIYFDFNDPIITNTFTTTFVETLSVDRFDSNRFRIYPNPAKDEVVIQLANSNFETGKVNIYDIHGKAIMKDIKFEGNSSSINLTDLESGMYFIELMVGNLSSIQKLIVN